MLARDARQRIAQNLRRSVYVAAVRKRGIDIRFQAREDGQRVEDAIRTWRPARKRSEDRRDVTVDRVYATPARSVRRSKKAGVAVRTRARGRRPAHANGVPAERSEIRRDHVGG